MDSGSFVPKYVFLFWFEPNLIRKSLSNLFMFYEDCSFSIAMTVEDLKHSFLRSKNQFFSLVGNELEKL
jgi:hypothetical protein